ncbi:hypothetical protein FRC09_016165 [Ceratobasidium sp. 395]|nr:hypothetical protein FRC09_016165 [Ceratobasidium sp. 395]
MFAPNQYKKALVLCRGVADVKPDGFVDIEEEEGELEGIGDNLGDLLVEDGELKAEPEPEDEGTSKKKKKAHKRQKMDLDFARFITKNGCRVKVFDEASENPARDSCYSKARRSETRNELTVDFESGHEVTSLAHKTKAKVSERTGEEYILFQTHLNIWRDNIFLQESETYCIGFEEIMTDVSLEAVVRS